jgi:metacaspase-1
MARRALLVGLNSYPNPANALRGCLNDVRQMHGVLKAHFGFDESKGTLLLTDSSATTTAIKNGLAWLVAGARAGDVLVFHYSGHGSQVPDRHGDERTDGLDEIICPYDLDWDAPFTDDDLYALVKEVPAGVNFTVVLDCCHAGTGLRELRGAPAPPAGDRASARVPRSKCLRRPGSDAGGRARAVDAPRVRVRHFGRGAVEDGAVLIAACRDDQVSADAFIDGDYHGALTYLLCKALEEADYTTTYGDLVRRVRRLLHAAGFDQEPQLEGPGGTPQEEVFAAARQGFALGPRV